MIFELAQDFSAVLEAIPKSHKMGETIEQLSEALEMSIHVLATNTLQLASQLHGRLGGVSDTFIITLLQECRVKMVRPWFRPVTRCLATPGGPLLRVLRGHGEACAVAFTPDDRRIISAHSRNKEELIEEIWRAFPGYCVVDARGRRIVEEFGKLKIWDRETGSEICELDGKSAWGITFSVTPDGRRLVSSSTASLVVWDSETWTQVRELELPHQYLVTLAALPDGRRLVSASYGAGFVLWNLDTGEQIQRFEGQPGVFGLSGDGTKILLCEHGGRVRFREIEGDQEFWYWPRHMCPDCIAVAPDGKRAICGFCGGWPHPKAEIWDLVRGAVVHRMNEHRWDGVAAVAVSSDGELGFAACGCGDIMVWSMESGQHEATLRTHQEELTTIAISHDTRFVASGSRQGDVRLWNLEVLLSEPNVCDSPHRARNIAIAPDGEYIVTNSPENYVRVCSVDCGELLREMKGHAGAINALAVDPSGKLAVSGSDDQTICIWRLESGECQVLTGHQHAVTALCISPDGRQLASFSSGDRDVRIWNLRSGELLSAGRMSMEIFGGFARLGNNELGLVGSWEDMVVTYHAAERTLLDRWYGFGEVIAIAVSVSGEQVLSSAREHHHCILWDPRSGDHLARIPMHRTIKTIAMSPDSSVAATACEDGMVKLWDLRSLEGFLPSPRKGVRPRMANARAQGIWMSCFELASFSFDATVSSCAVGPAGRRLIATDKSGDLHILHLENLDLIG
jgi:WD40 repeat protein